MSNVLKLAVMAVGLAIGLAAVATAQPLASTQSAPATAAARMDAKFVAMAKADIDAGLKYLLTLQNADGGWGKPFSMPAFTALTLKALVQSPDHTLTTPAVARGYESLLKSVQPDGGIYDPKVGQENYTTSVAVMALAAAKDPKFKPVIDAAVKYLEGLQIVEGSASPAGTPVTREHPFYGGTSYGEHGRPDLSNLSFTVDALHEAGVPKTDPFFARAVVFLARTQNRSESNDQPWAEVVNDGGFVYAPLVKDAAEATGESKADFQEVNGRRGLRSYGSMTYSGFKSMLYANVSRDDPRVRAAFDWIRTYWRLDSNPNMPQVQSKQGLYYYYMVFAKALRAWGQDVIVDARGVKHNWREELVQVLHEQHKADGSWANTEPRWFENMPDLVTAYSVLALEECLK
jgi:squalene-hopene/tetraprenyl-beta-curcumene cyclase